VARHRLGVRRRILSLLVWGMMGIAIWHFAVFVPDRFWGGIVGAFLAAIAGAMLVGLAAAAGSIDDPSLTTALEAVPGAIFGLAIAYFIGIRSESMPVSRR
jgi:hypothetical protein